jgi:hypothetical protein
MSGEQKLGPGILILTGNAPNESFGNVFKSNPALRERFKQVVIEPLSSDDISRITGKLAAKKFGDEKMTDGEEKALGETVKAVLGAEADESQGLRGMVKKIETALTQPLPAEAEEKLAAVSPAFAARTASRRGDRLAEAFHRKIEVQPMKKLRLVKPSAKV